jgi:PD-(D/E)XK nuclease superfamily
MTLDPTHLTTGSTSPFLPGTKIQFAWDSTCLGLIKSCPRKYQYEILEGWQSKSESVHLRFGSEYHAALQHYDILRAEGVDHDDAIHQTIKDLHSRTHDWVVDTSTKSGKYKNRDTLLGLVVDYLDHYRDDPCETYILDNGKPAVELSFRFELDWGPEVKSTASDPYTRSMEDLVCASLSPHQPYLLSGHLDRVVRFNDQLFVMDHKTTTTTPGDYYFDQYEPDCQMSLYTLAGRVVLNSPIRGVIIRAAQILLEKPHRFVSGFTYRTPDQLDEWLLDLRFYLNQAEAYAESDYWPQNDKACNMYGGCKFRGICSKNPEQRKAFLQADFNKLEPDARWNPIKSRG